MELLNQVKIVQKGLDKCSLLVEPECSYGQLYDFGVTLTSFALAQMKIQEEKLAQEKASVDAASSSQPEPEQVQA